MIKDLCKDLAKYLPSQLVPSILGIIAVPIITRLFLPEDYGNYVLVTATIAVSSLIAVSWIGSSIIRFWPAYDLSNETKKFAGVFFRLTLASIGIIGVIFAATLFFARDSISEKIYYLMRIGLLVFITGSLSGVLLQLLRARRWVTWYTSFTIWLQATGLGLGIVLVMIFRFGVDGLLWGAFVTTAVTLPVLWKVSLGALSFVRGKIRSPITREMARYGIPATGITILAWVLSLSDRYILELFRGSAEVGIYAASYNISEKSMFFITSLFLLSSTPIAFGIWEKKGAEKSKEFVTKVTRYYILIGLPAAAGLSILAKPIIGILVAPEYLPGYSIVPLVASGAFLLGIAQRFTLGLAFHKKNHLSMLCYMASGLLNVVLNFILIPRYGYRGAALTTFISYACSMVLTILVSRRFFAWAFPLSSLFKASCAAAVMGAAIYLMKNSFGLPRLTGLILVTFIAAAAYFTALLLLGEFTAREKGIVKNLLH